ncbi:ABC transporter permease [Musicola paradisiaca]|uniref:Binding-protein-dependent transport systems inner membrane component n=1 Tax=Musicola paradisiaca (strain Ech703) TaxID=579405 RepID=C6C4I1_MUSP7|nr:ABC transporter permease [Musicola paradisiaca]ACS85555.1 binding-protein-dependent transport systems inner membrane component [Musicola paradisiaca Ech703]
MSVFHQYARSSLTLTGNLLSRFLSLFLTLLSLLFFTFLLTHIAAIDPTLSVVGEYANDATYEQARRQLGLDQPLWRQFFHYLAALLHGDLGISRTTSQPVLQDLLRTFPATVELATCAMVIGVVGGVLLALISALKPGGWVDYLIRLICLMGYSVPVFWLGLLSLMLFYAGLHWAPGGGRLDAFSPHVQETWRGFLLVGSVLTGDYPRFCDALSHLWLPSGVLGLLSMAGIARMLRAAMLEECGKEYVTQARAIGAGQMRILFFHILPNIQAVLVTVTLLAYAGLLEGAVLTESIFSWPGVGRYLTTALFSADVPAVLGATLLIGICFILMNALADALLFLLDPRTR